LLPKPKIAERAVLENKGGPRIRDVLDHIVDLHSLVEMGEFDENQREVFERGDIFSYLLIQGIDSH
jgi:hypothetical protein